MRKAGCRMLMIGFEFGTNKQLILLRKERQLNSEENSPKQLTSWDLLFTDVL